MLDPSLYDPEFLAKIKRVAEPELSHASSTSEFAAAEPAGERTRKEATDMKIPNKLPTVNNLVAWNVTVAGALIAASAYGDRAEVAWLRECSDSTKGFEHFAKPLLTWLTITSSLRGNWKGERGLCLIRTHCRRDGKFASSITTSSKPMSRWELGLVSTTLVV